ncbi:MAG: PDZ domain-containing protein [Planctomycetota bacterium]|jgi:S1-C subfamily serine protease|nr:PDZ domain-containing protein [Planctomycetota bacterium]
MRAFTFCLTLLLTICLGTATAQQEDSKDFQRQLIELLDKKLEEIRKDLLHEIERRMGPTNRPRSIPSPAAKGAYLGVSLEDLSDGARIILNIPEGTGSKVTRVHPNSAADRAGLLENDVILSIDGQTVRGYESLSSTIRSHKPGDQIQMTLLRQNKKVNVRVTLGKREASSTVRRIQTPANRDEMDRFLDRTLRGIRRPGNTPKRLPRPQARIELRGPEDLKKLLEDPKAREQMMEQAKKFMEQFGGNQEGPQGDQLRKLLEQGMQRYQEMMKDPQNRERMQKMAENLKKNFGQKGPNSGNMMETLQRMLENQGQQNRPEKDESAPRDDKINRMLDELLEGTKKIPSSGKRPAKSKLATPRRAFLGISIRPITPAIRAQLQIPEGEGVVIGGVKPGSPADQAGLIPQDILLAIDKKPIVSVSDLSSALESKKSGETLKLTVLRKGETLEIDTLLGGR